MWACSKYDSPVGPHLSTKYAWRGLKPSYQAGRWFDALCPICVPPLFDLAASQNEISDFGPARAMSTSAFLRLSVGSAACCAPIRGPIRGSKRCCSGLHHREQSSCEDISHRSSRWGGLLAGINVSGAGVVQVAPPDKMYKFTSHFGPILSEAKTASNLKTI